MKNIITILMAIVMVLAASARSHGLLECYTSSDPMAEPEPHAGCATVRDKTIAILPDHLRRLSYSDNGLATILIGRQHYYVKRSGALLPVVTFDNWADDFSEGLVRSLVQGKVAFFDTNFRGVIAPRYDWAWPFKGGRSLVCLGCIAERSHRDGHITVSGGRWGFINKKGIEVVPVRFSREEAMKQ